LLDGPHYTRPEEWKGRSVPPVLLSGHHADIQTWRRRQALQATLERRPDLIASARVGGRLAAIDEKVLRELARSGDVSAQELVGRTAA
jgi:tRNA (guanine37-N1)-methyltransferase